MTRINFCLSGYVLGKIGYDDFSACFARITWGARDDSKDVITWVPVSSPGMTEFLKKILFLFTMLNFCLS